MKRGYLAIGLGIVVVAGVALYGATRGSGSDGGDRAASEGAADPRNAEPAVRGAAPPPSAERAGRAAPLPPSSTSTDYVVGDVRVRDHRTGTHDQLDVAPVIHAPTGPKIASQLSSDIAKNIRGVVAECAATVPADARGARSRFEGQVKIAIANQVATITSAALRLRDVTGDSSAIAQQCIEQKVIGISTPSGNEPDIEGYGITLSLRLP
jgi:hypothetical protein